MDDSARKQLEAAQARMVEFWRQHDEMEARLTRPVSERMLDMARVSAGMRVLDVASGRGEPALPAAHREAWEKELATEVEKHRVGERVLLGGVTKLTLARTSGS